MKNIFSKDRFVLNRTNVWIKMVLRLNKFMGNVNLWSFIIIAIIVFLDAWYLTLLCVITILGANLFLKGIVVMGVSNACFLFKKNRIYAINTLDKISFILGFMAIIITGTELNNQKTIIELVVIILVAILVHITSIENIHRLWIAIRLQRRYDVSKDIELTPGNKVIAYNGSREVDGDMGFHNILCVEHDGYFELLLYSECGVLRRKLLLVNNNDRGNIGIDDLEFYTIITEMRSGDIVINIDNIKGYV